MTILNYGPWNANDLFDFTHKNDGVNRPLSFLNVKIGNRFLDEKDISKPTDLTKENLQGCGIYTIYYKKNLIYVGSYFGSKSKKNNSKRNIIAENIRGARWTHHLSSVTMRGYTINIARRLWTAIHESGSIFDKELDADFLLDFRKGLNLREQDSYYRRQAHINKKHRDDRTLEERNEYAIINKSCMSVIGGGATASNKRILFANTFWSEFKPVSNEDTDRLKYIFSDFDFYYVKDKDAPLYIGETYKNGRNYEEHIMREVEDKSIEVFNSFVNGVSPCREFHLGKDNTNEVQSEIVAMYEIATNEKNLSQSNY